MLAFNVMVPAAVSLNDTAPVEAAVMVFALIEFAPANVIPAVPALKFTVAEFSAAAPVIPLAAPLAFNVNEVPELPFSVIALFAVSMSETTPVEFAVSVVALMVLTPVKLIPFEPEVRLAVAAFKVPPPVIPLAPALAFRVNAEPELPFSVIAFAVSIIETAPVEFAVKSVALTVFAPVKLIPLVPAVRLVVAEFKTPAPVMLLLAPLAFSVNEVPELPFRLIAPFKLSMIDTAPVELTVNVLAFIVLTPVKFNPAVPAVKLVVAELRTPAPVMPLATAVAFTVNVDPELPFNVTELAVSTIETAPVEFAVRLVALTVLAPVKLIPFVPAVRLVVAEFRTPAPVTPLLTPLAFKVNDEPELPFKLIAPFKVSMIDTAPLEFAVKVLAFTVLAPVKFKPTVPAVKLVVAEFKTPTPVMPLAAPLAFRVNDVPELAFKVMPLFATSVTDTAPLELAVTVVAFVEAIVAPAAPAVIVNAAVFKPVATLVDDTEPVAAERVMEVAAL